MTDRSLDLLRPVEIRSRADIVLERLQTLILSGQLKAGDRLPSEPELARALQVGRSTVREAKKALVVQGLLEPRGRHGTFVAAPSAGSDDVSRLLGLLSNPTLRDLHESRQIVEVAAIKLAAERATLADVADMQRTLERLGAGFKPGESDVWAMMVEFHRDIVQASGNRVLVSVFDLIARLIRTHQVPFYGSIADPGSELRSHQELLDLIRERDPEAAAAAMTDHLEDAERLRSEALDEMGGRDEAG